MYGWAMSVGILFAADGAMADRIIESLCRREQTLARATWSYAWEQHGTKVVASRSARIIVSDGAVCYVKFRDGDTTKDIQSPTQYWLEGIGADGRTLSVTKRRVPEFRSRKEIYDSVEMQGLFDRGRFTPLSHSLKMARFDGVESGQARFTLRAPKPNGEVERTEYFIEADPPFRFRSFRFHGDESRLGHDYVENLEFGSIAGVWYPTRGKAGTRHASKTPSEWHADITITDMQLDTPPIDFARLEGLLKRDDINVFDEFSGVTRMSKQERVQMRQRSLNQANRAKEELAAIDQRPERLDATPYDSGPSTVFYSLAAVAVLCIAGIWAIGRRG